MSLVCEVEARNQSGRVVHRHVAIQPVDGFAVFYDYASGWTVTHIRTGFAVKKQCCCLYSAVLIAELVAPVIYWSGSTDDINAAGRSAGLREKVAAIKCPKCQREEAPAPASEEKP